MKQWVLLKSFEGYARSVAQMSRECIEGVFNHTDRDRLDLPVIHNFLSKESYWAGSSR